MNTILFLCLLTVGQTPDQKWTNSGWAGMHDSKPAAEVKALSLPSFPKQTNKFAVDAPKAAPAKVEPPKESVKIEPSKVEPPKEPVKAEPPKVESPKERLPTAEPLLEPAKVDLEPARKKEGIGMPPPTEKPVVTYDPGSAWYRGEKAWIFGKLEGNRVVTKSDEDIIPFGEAGEKLKSWQYIGNNYWAWGVNRNGSVVYQKDDITYSATPPTGGIVRANQGIRVQVTAQPPVQSTQDALLQQQFQQAVNPMTMQDQLRTQFFQPRYQMSQPQMSSPCASGNCSRR